MALIGLLALIGLIRLIKPMAWLMANSANLPMGLIRPIALIVIGLIALIGLLGLGRSGWGVGIEGWG